MSAETKLTARSALSVLRNAPYRRYIIGSAISDTGTWMQVMAQGYVMSTLTTNTAVDKDFSGTLTGPATIVLNRYLPGHVRAGAFFYNAGGLTDATTGGGATATALAAIGQILY